MCRVLCIYNTVHYFVNKFNNPYFDWTNWNYVIWFLHLHYSCRSSFVPLSLLHCTCFHTFVLFWAKFSWNKERSRSTVPMSRKNADLDYTCWYRSCCYRHRLLCILNESVRETLASSLPWHRVSLGSIRTPIRVDTARLNTMRHLRDMNLLMRNDIKGIHMCCWCMCCVSRYDIFKNMFVLALLFFSDSFFW